MSVKTFELPQKEGWYWAKWRIADDGTDNCRHCGHKHSEWEDRGGLSIETWGVVEVVENCLDPDDPEHFMVQVPGVSRWQSLLNFVWGPMIEVPAELR